MQLVKSFFFLLVLGTASFFMPHAKATCTTPDMPKMINVASVSVPTTLPVGKPFQAPSRPFTSRAIAMKASTAALRLSPATTAPVQKFPA